MFTYELSRSDGTFILTTDLPESKWSELGPDFSVSDEHGNRLGRISITGRTHSYASADNPLLLALAHGVASAIDHARKTGVPHPSFKKRA